MDRNRVLKALNRLGDVLADHGKHFELTCAGGIVSLLYFRSRDHIGDIDAIFPEPWEGLGVLKSSIKTVQDELSLPDDWINDSMMFFGVDTKSDNVIFNHPNLKLIAADWNELLAHKLNAYRSDLDIKDAVLILKEANPPDKELFWNSVVEYKPITPKISLNEFRRRFDEVWNLVERLKGRLKQRHHATSG